MNDYIRKRTLFRKRDISELSKIGILSQKIEEYYQKLIKEIPEEFDDFSVEEEEEKEDGKKNNKIDKEIKEDNIYTNIDVKKR